MCWRAGLPSPFPFRQSSPQPQARVSSSRREAKSSAIPAAWYLYAARFLPAAAIMSASCSTIPASRSASRSARWKNSDRHRPRREKKPEEEEGGGHMVTLSVLDQSPIRKGGSAAEAFANTIDLAQQAERLGYSRYWLAEHHNTSSFAGSAPEVLIAAVAAA